MDDMSWYQIWILKKPKGWTFIAIFFEIKENPYTLIFGLVGKGVGEISERNFWIFAKTLFYVQVHSKCTAQKIHFRIFIF